MTPARLKELASASAFPSNASQYGPEYGLTKREYIATQALQGLLADSREYAGEPSPTAFARAAVAAADALLAELAK